jgi:hypothetical protein
MTKIYSNQEIQNKLNPFLDTLVKLESEPQYRVRFFSNTALMVDNIPTTEIYVDKTQTECRVRNYSLWSLEDLETICRAKTFIEAMGLKVKPQDY